MATWCRYVKWQLIVRCDGDLVPICFVLIVEWRMYCVNWCLGRWHVKCWKNFNCRWPNDVKCNTFVNELLKWKMTNVNMYSVSMAVVRTKPNAVLACPDWKRRRHSPKCQIENEWSWIWYFNFKWQMSYLFDVSWFCWKPPTWLIRALALTCPQLLITRDWMVTDRIPDVILIIHNWKVLIMIGSD